MSETKLVEVEAILSVNFEKKTYGPGKLFSLPEALAEALSDRKIPAVKVLSFLEAEKPVVPGNPDAPVDGLTFLEVKPGVKEVLIEAGIDTLELVKGQTESDLVDLPKIGVATAKSILEQAFGAE